jgi:hypothetical protein
MGRAWLKMKKEKEADEISDPLFSSSWIYSIFITDPISSGE